MNKPIAFFDRDGTLIYDKHYLKEPNLVELMPKAKETLARLKQLNYIFVIVSNQSGIARGFLNEDDFFLVNQKLFSLLGFSFDKVYFCPHLNTNCNCRKPKSGMLLQALEDLGYQKAPKGSFMVGDAIRDCQAAANINLQSFFLGETKLNLPNNCQKIKHLFEMIKYLEMN